MSEKGKSILAYLFGWLGGIIVLYAVKNNERNTKFHAAQSIVFGIAYFAISTIYSFIPITIPFFGMILGTIYIVAIIMGIVKASKNEDPELPLVGNIAKSIFGKKIDE